MDLVPYPQAARLTQDTTIDLETNPQPTEPPLGDNDKDIVLPPYPPVAHLTESRVSPEHEINDVESNLPRTELTSSYTGISYHQRIQKLLGIFFVSKAIQARMKLLSKLPSVTQIMQARIEQLAELPQAMQTRIRRLRKLPHVIRATQAHIVQVSRIPHLVRAMQASIERLSRRPPLIQVMSRSSSMPASDPIPPHPALRPKWCCFICIDIAGREPVAMKIPCPPRKPGTGLNARETQIYENIKQRLTTYYGMSRFLPFYGVKDVQEVNFQFISSAVDSHGSFKVVVCPLLFEQIRDEAKNDLRVATGDKEEECRGNHTIACLTATGDNEYGCIHYKAELAKLTLRNLGTMHLFLECVRAGRVKTILGALEEGWVQKSCVIRTSTVVLPKPDEAYNETREIPGLKISLGWQYDRIKGFIPLGLVWGFLAVSLVFVCTAWWENGTKDTGTALAFGQLVAALIALILVIADR